jgi:DNA-binding NarL/FixJ family response regulator
MFKISIIEDDPAISKGIEVFVSMQDDFRFIGSYASVETYLNSNAEPPDVLLLDIELPGMSGLEGAFRIKQRQPLTEILMLTVYEDKERIFKALQAGASGYLLKNTSFPKLKAAILEVLGGGAPMSPIIAKKVVAYFKAVSQPAVANKNEQLTAREQEVSLLLIEGNTYKQIAYSLYISPDTVRQHIKNIYRKLQINSRVQLIREFNRN